MRDGRLFRDGELRQYLEGIQATAVNQVAAEPPDDVRFIPDVVVERIWNDHRVEPVSLDFDAITRTAPREGTEEIEQWGERYTVPIQIVSIIVPRTGDAELLRRQASTFTTGTRNPAMPPTGRVGTSVFSPRGCTSPSEIARGFTDCR